MIQMMLNEDSTALLPTNDAGRNALAQYTPGQAVPVTFAESASHRNLRRHVFGVLGKIARAINTDPETLRVIMLIRTGRCHMLQVPLTTAPRDGRPVTEMRTAIVVESMARQCMDEDELRSFYVEMRRIIHERMLAEIPEPARSEIAGILDAD
jgi:hypothetical protein